MVDDLTNGGASAAFHCPWCSAVLPASDLETCSSCGATLTSAPDAALPGVTAIDHEAILQAGREPARQPRSRLLSWLSGEYVAEGTPAEPQAIARPDPAVRAEILRLEIEAELADRKAEVDSILADAAVEGSALPQLDEAPTTAGDSDQEVAAEAVAPPGPDVPATADPEDPARGE
jgi:hypothetical protein